MRSTPVCVAVVLLAVSAAEGAEKPAPPTNYEWNMYRAQFQTAQAAGDYTKAEDIAVVLYDHCMDAFGPEHPDTRCAASALYECRTMQSTSPENRDKYRKLLNSMVQVGQLLNSEEDNVFPRIAQLGECLEQFRTVMDTIPRVGSIRLREAECWDGMSRVASAARMMEMSEACAAKAYDLYAVDDGGFLAGIYTQLRLADLFREQQKTPEQQISLLERIVESVERHQKTPRLYWCTERVLTKLAETHFWLGNRAEADRLYASVRKQLPEKSVYSVPYWCKSWCDRHEARQLMERGDHEGAYEKILSARLGTIKYGHLNLNKGLTMERILRLSAENRRKLGRDKEADEDLAYAQRIADHAARLKAAMEPEFERLEIKIGPTTKTAAPADRNLVPGR